MIDRINCEYTDEIICPYCGYKQGDIWEYFDNENFSCDGHNIQVSCAECNKTFECYLHVSYSYSTEKINPASNKKIRNSQAKT